ncbi:MAG: hypothetical protein RL637_785 [Pseudomonadota bacterium]|jgi:hypothetical protein
MIRNLIYLTAIADERLKKQRHLIGISPAATHKIFNLSQVLSKTFDRVIIISLARGQLQNTADYFSAKACKLNRVKIIYASGFDLIFFNHLIASISTAYLLSKILSRLNTQHTALIIYNRFWHYLPALLVARYYQINCHLDLEDGLLIKHLSLIKKIIYILQKKCFELLCNQSILLASNQLISQLSTPSYYICYGVALRKRQPSIDLQKTPIICLLTGSLMADTGVLLLIETIKLLDQYYPNLSSQFKFIITGQSDQSTEFALVKAGSEINAELFSYLGFLSDKDYHQLCLQADIHLCLKRSDSMIGLTTFPSKVIEIASYGHVLISTALTEVMHLFSEKGAYYLFEETAENLLNILLTIYHNPDIAIQKAWLGQQRVLDYCHPQKINYIFQQLVNKYD